jgi:hypothetical protein
MELLVREIRPDEVEQEITQRDQFNTDTVGLAETLVREAHQNSMDGVSKINPPPSRTVRTRITITDARIEDGPFWTSLFEPLRPHLEACGIPLAGIDISKPRLLVIEDFETTGLLGAIDQKDASNFSDFWRRTGTSHKRGDQGGRWGLGKLVFSSASRIRTFFGLTVQESDDVRIGLLMGQAVLKTHRIGEGEPREFAPHAFFAVRGPREFQLPETDVTAVAAFSAAAGLVRTREPGLSIVVPFVHDDITPEAMLPHLIRNWFFPILTGKLVVEIGPFVLDQTTFSQLAKDHGGPDFADGRRVDFISDLNAARASSPATMLQNNWTSDGIERATTEESLQQLRVDYAAGKLIAIRAPLVIRPKTGSVEPTFVDLYLQSSPETTRGEALFVRGAITIPGEARRFRGRGCLAALVAEDHTVAAFLGDAEGPAHTMWSGTAEKVREGWKNPSERLKEIRDVLNQFYQAVAQIVDQLDPDALIDVFFVNRAGESKITRRRNPVVKKPTIPPIPRRPSAYRLIERKGGFAIRSTEHTTLPLQILVKTAYDVVDGNPIRQHNKLDFDLSAGEISIDSKGAAVNPSAPNEILIDVSALDFAVTLSGFDENRDLFVKAERKS